VRSLAVTRIEVVVIWLVGLLVVCALCVWAGLSALPGVIFYLCVMLYRWHREGVFRSHAEPAQRPQDSTQRLLAYKEAMAELDAIDERSGLNWIISYVQGKMGEPAQPVRTADPWAHSWPQSAPGTVTIHKIDGVTYRVHYPSNACYEQLPDGAGWRYAGTVPPSESMSIDDYYLARKRAFQKAAADR
jgi:hypothetical protein